MLRYYAPDQPSRPAPVRERRPTPLLEVSSCARSQLGEALSLVETSQREQHPRIGDWIREHKKEFCEPARPIWIAKEEGTLTGVLIARMDKTKDAKCSLLFVTDKFRENQLRTELLRAFEQAASLLGKSTVHLQLYADDQQDVAFFRSHGYQVAVAETYHPTENPGRIRILMVKRPLLRT